MALHHKSYDPMEGLRGEALAHPDISVSLWTVVCIVKDAKELKAVWSKLLKDKTYRLPEMQALSNIASAHKIELPVPKRAWWDLR